MSAQGVALLSRVALVAVLLITTALVRVLVGPSRRPGVFMGIGTLGGMAIGIAGSSVLSPWLASDVSTICTCLGILGGWGIAWVSARRIPRET